MKNYIKIVLAALILCITPAAFAKPVIISYEPVKPIGLLTNALVGFCANTFSSNTGQETMLGNMIGLLIVTITQSRPKTARLDSSDFARTTIYTEREIKSNVALQFSIEFNLTNKQVLSYALGSILGWSTRAAYDKLYSTENDCTKAIK